MKDDQNAQENKDFKNPREDILERIVKLQCKIETSESEYEIVEDWVNKHQKLKEENLQLKQLEQLKSLCKSKKNFHEIVSIAVSNPVSHPEYEQWMNNLAKKAAEITISSDNPLVIPKLGELTDPKSYLSTHPLLLAIAHKNHYAINVMLANGVDKNIQDSFGRNALDYAGFFGNIDAWNRFSAKTPVHHDTIVAQIVRAKRSNSLLAPLLEDSTVGPVFKYVCEAYLNFCAMNGEFENFQFLYSSLCIDEKIKKKLLAATSKGLDRTRSTAWRNPKKEKRYNDIIKLLEQSTNNLQAASVKPWNSRSLQANISKYAGMGICIPKIVR